MGWTTQLFDCDAGGGSDLERSVRDGKTAAVIEISLTELAAGQIQPGRGEVQDRLTSAALVGIPQVVTLGGLDGAVVPVTSKTGRLFTEFAGRRYARTSPEENDRLGREIAYKVSASRGPVTIIMPLGGLSALDEPGQPFWDPAADDALFKSLCNWLDPNVPVREVPGHLFSAECAQEIVAAFRRMTSA